MSDFELSVLLVWVLWVLERLQVEDRNIEVVKYIRAEFVLDIGHELVRIRSFVQQVVHGREVHVGARDTTITFRNSTKHQFKFNA